MIVELEISDWGNPVITYICKDADMAIQMLFDANEAHSGAIAKVTIGDESIELDFAKSPDFEGEILKLQRKVFKKNRQKSQKNTTKILLKKDPNYFKNLGKKRWEKCSCYCHNPNILFDGPCIDKCNHRK